MKKLTALALALAMIICLLPAGSMALSSNKNITDITGTTTNDVSWSASYSASQASGITTGTCDITFTVNAGNVSPNGVEIPINEVLQVMLDSHKIGSTMPSNKFQINVTVNNKSCQKLVYKDSSLAVDSSFKLYNNDGKLGNNGYNVLRIGNITTQNPVIMSLCDKTSGSISANEVLSLYNKLKTKGYEEPTALRDYFVDYYKNKLSLKNLTWEQLITTYYDKATEYFYGSNTGNDEFAIPGDDKNTWLKDNLANNRQEPYVYEDGSDMYVKWPDPDIAQLTYDIFYDDLLFMQFGVEANAVKSKEANGVTRAYGIGDYADTNGERYIEANAYLKNAFDGGIEASGNKNFKFVIALEHEGAGNVYGCYAYSFTDMFALTLTLVPDTPAVTPTPTPSDTPTVTPTPSETPTPSGTPEETPAPSGTPEETPTPEKPQCRLTPLRLPLLPPQGAIITIPRLRLPR